MCKSGVVQLILSCLNAKNGVVLVCVIKELGQAILGHAVLQSRYCVNYKALNHQKQTNTYKAVLNVIL